jgi:hypothetical protein
MIYFGIMLISSLGIYILETKIKSKSFSMLLLSLSVPSMFSKFILIIYR